MKHFNQFLLTMLVALLGVVDANAVNDNDFSVQNSDGVTIYYKKLTSKTVAVADCSWCSSLNIPSSVKYGSTTYSVTEIGSSAFSGKVNLTSITIPNSITKINSSAFWECTNLSTITIPNSVTELGKAAFSGCTNLSSITIPNSVTDMGGSVFSRCTKLSSITIPNSVTELGSSVFSGCTNLSKINLPSGLTNIDGHCFDETKFYNTESNWSDGELYIGKYLIAVNKEVETFTVREGTRLIAGNAFTNNDQIENIVIPETVISLGSGCFTYCENLKSVKLPKNIKIIRSSTFMKCSSLQEIEIPKGVEEIGDYVFWHCEGLKQIILNEGLKKIGYQAFFCCFSLYKIYLPESVEEIRSSAFASCRSITNIVIPEGIDSINGGCFRGCSSLTEVVLPESIKKINGNAFRSCSSLSSITLPSYVEALGVSAFSNCTGLREIKSLNQTPPTIEDATTFENVPSLDCIIKVPKGAVEAYSNADYWNKFFYIEEIEGETPPVEYQTENVLAIEQVKANNGKTVELPVVMKNTKRISDVGFVVELPEGITLDKTAKGKYYVNFTDRADGHTMTANEVAGGVKMAIVNMDGTPFDGNDGAILTLPLNIGKDLADGDYTVRLKEIQLSDGNLYEAADAEGTVTVLSYTKGDVNNDGKIAMNDISLTIQGYLGNFSDDFVMYAADMNDNGQLDMADISQVINAYLNSSSAAPRKAVTRAGGDNLTLENVTAEAGKQVELVIGLNNSKEYTDIGGYISLPEGITFAKNSKGKYLISLDRYRLPEHTISTQLQANGELKFAIVNMAGDPVEGNSGTIMQVTVDVAETLAAGDYQVKLREIQLSDGNLYETGDVTATVSVVDNAAISDVSVDGKDSAVFYRIDGTKCAKASAPGLYIKNGKKFVVN